MLAEAALRKKKVAPMFKKTKNRKEIRLRALQHMIVCNLRRNIAMEVKTICDTKFASQTQMERIRKIMKNYGPLLIMMSH